MIAYRSATAADAEAIARLHAKSWQDNYRGILYDEYLDEKVVTDRLDVWKKRFEDIAPNQFCLLAEEDGNLCGLACTYFHDDPRWGALLDNLHVLNAWKRRGIGAEMMALTAREMIKLDLNQPLYLWVFEENHAARKFYDRMGGIIREESEIENPGGGKAPILRYVWEDVSTII